MTNTEATNPELTIPNSPNDMPRDLDSSGAWMRNTFAGLERHHNIELRWENIGPDSSGESFGCWHLGIMTRGGKYFSAEGRNLVSVLWYVSEHANHADDAFWKNYEMARTAALSKLTPEDRQLLGL